MSVETLDKPNEVAQKTYTLKPEVEKRRKYLLQYFPFKSYMLSQLPLALFAGLRIRKITTETCEVSLPYGWRSQNPFRSIYFAALSMAAEMSTGAMGMLAVQNSDKNVSILIVSMEAQFTKKANQLTTFTCNDGHKVFAAVEEAEKTGEGVKVQTESIGRMKDGTEVARFKFVWSFKARMERG